MKIIDHIVCQRGHSRPRYRRSNIWSIMEINGWRCYCFLIYIQMEMECGLIDALQCRGTMLWNIRSNRAIRYHWNSTQDDIDQNTNEAIYSSMAQDAKIKLNSIIPHFRSNINWQSWIYLQAESCRIFQNSQRLLKGDSMNRAHNRPTGDQLLQQSMFGDWNIINEKISATLPAFIRTGEPFFRNAELNINALLKSFLLPQLFLTLTFSEH